MQQSMTVVIEIMRLNQQLRQLINSWSVATELSFNELRILLYLRRHPASRIGEVAHSLEIAKSSLAQNISELIDRDWLESQPIRRDRRLRVLTLTTTGNRRMTHVMSILKQSLSTDQALALIETIDRLQNWQNSTASATHEHLK